MSKTDSLAIAYAIILSLACLSRGAVHEVTIAVLLLVSLPFLVVAARNATKFHPAITKAGLTLALVVAAVLALQFLALLFQASLDPVDASLHSRLDEGGLYDKAAWLQGIGKIAFLATVFVISLHIGSTHYGTRSFLLALLISGGICVAVTFFTKTGAIGVLSHSYSYYSHGFVNPNNAASYLGIMLLLALAQMGHFILRFKSKTRKILPEIIDTLNIKTVIHGTALFFCVPLFFAGLLMTGSRGGILFAFLAIFCFFGIILVKSSTVSQPKRLMFLGIILAALAIVSWSLSNFGLAFGDSMKREGLALHSRLEISSAVGSMIAANPWLGTGLGSFPAAFQMYRPTNIMSEGLIDKAHNSYLEFAAELGVPALLVFLTVIALFGYALYQGIKKREKQYFFPVFGFSVWLLLVLHSLIDFPMQIPGLAAVALAITTVCASQADKHFSDQTAPIDGTRYKRKRIRKRSKRSTKSSGAAEAR